MADMATKRCTKCQTVKSTTEFYKAKENKDGLDYRCRSCFQIYNEERFQRGLEILQSFALSRGCCNHCSRPYSNEEWHFFEFDHIDPSLKRSKRETESKWVAAFENEFFERVAPNLQLLCIKCHKIKTRKEAKLGGVVHQKMSGQSKPAEVVELDWSLFRQPPTLEPNEQYTYHSKEGEWITVRDINGKLISFEPYQNFIKTK